MSTRTGETNDVGATDEIVGDADSVTTKPLTNGTEFTWRVKVSPQLATVNMVRVAAFAYPINEDGTLGDAGDAEVVISPKSEQFNVDGDRPKNPSHTLAFNNGRLLRG